MANEHARDQTLPLFEGERKRLLLVASTGGHLSQLVRLARREGADDSSLWVTFDSPQSRSLLHNKPIFWADYVAPRDLSGTLRLYRRLQREVDAASFDGVLSTGAAVAVAAMLWAKRNRLPGVYVESVSRTHGPSLTGHIVRATGLATTYTQHASWASKNWRLTGSVLSDFTRPGALNIDSAVDAPATLSHPGHELDTIAANGPRDSAAPLRVLVTLGTIRPYRFDRLVDRIVDIIYPDDQVVWQLGDTERDELPGESHRMLDNDALLREAQQADVVITHSGVGTILELLEHGVSPVVVPRRSEWNEHVDNHQLQIFEHLREKGVAYPTEVPNLTRDILLAAANGRRLEIDYDGATSESPDSENETK